MLQQRSSRRRFSAKHSATSAFRELAAGLAEAGRAFYARGWVLGTSGNFSAIVAREPLRLAITSSGVDKGALTATQFLEIDENLNILRGSGAPSAEALLHLALVRAQQRFGRSTVAPGSGPRARRRRGPAHAFGLEHDSFRVVCGPRMSRQ